MDPRFYEGDAAVHVDGTCWANLRCWTYQVRACSLGGGDHIRGQQQWAGRLCSRGADAER